MSENGEHPNQRPFERAAMSLKSRLYSYRGLHPVESLGEKRNLESELKAKKSVKEFISKSPQEPLATFQGDSQSMLDLSKYPQGTILRIEWSLHKPEITEEPRFSWYVIGDREKDSTYVYSISFVNKTPGLTLPIDDQPVVYSPSPIKLHPFPVADILFALTNPKNSLIEEQTQADVDFYHNHMPVHKLDVMALGRSEKSGAKEPKEITTRILIPTTAKLS